MYKYFLIIIFIILLCQHTFGSSYLEKIDVSDNLTIYKITENTYVHVSFFESQKWGRFGSNGLIYVDSNKAFLFDTPMSETLTIKLVEWIEKTKGYKLVGFVPNHWHDDCIGGLNYLHKLGIESYANNMTIDITKSKNLAVPKSGFNDSITLKLGSKQIICEYFGPAHSMDNIVVWLPSEKILFPGCMIKDVNSKTLGNTVDGDIKEWANTITKVKNKHPEIIIIVPGHGDWGGLELFESTFKLIKDYN